MSSLQQKLQAEEDRGTKSCQKLGMKVMAEKLFGFSKQCIPIARLVSYALTVQAT